MVDFFEEFTPEPQPAREVQLPAVGPVLPGALRQLLRGLEQAADQPGGARAQADGVRAGIRLHRRVPARRRHLDVSGRGRRGVRHQGEPAACLGDDHHRLRRASRLAASGDRLLLRRVQGGSRGPGAFAESRGTASWSRESRSPRSSRRSSIAAALRRELGLADRFTALLTAASGQPGDARDIASQLAGLGHPGGRGHRQQRAAEAAAGHSGQEEGPRAGFSGTPPICTR